MKPLFQCEELSSSLKSISPFKIKKDQKEFKCHYCYSLNEKRRYASCFKYPECTHSFCYKCLKNFFGMKEISIGKEWMCLVCQKICHCENCLEEAEKDALVVKDWRRGGYLKNEEKYHGPKVYSQESKVNSLLGKRSKKAHSKELNDNKTLKKPNLQEDIQAQAPPEYEEQHQLDPREMRVFPQLFHYPSVMFDPNQPHPILLMRHIPPPCYTPIGYPHPQLLLISDQNQQFQVPVQFPQMGGIGRLQEANNGILNARKKN